MVEARTNSGAANRAEPVRSTVRGVRVLGMHRSGTSVVAGAFARSSYFAGNGDEMRPGWDGSERSHFERRDVVRLNDALLGSLGAHWAVPPAPDAVRTRRGSLSSEVAPCYAGLLQSAAGNPVVLQDPRLSVLLPAWNAVSGDELLDVLVIRNPVAVAASLRRRDGFPIHFGLALWELYTVALLGGLRGRPVLVADFDRLAAGRGERDRWLQSAGRELRRLGLPFPDFADFDSADVHFRSDETDLMELGSREQLRLWRFLQDLDPLQPCLEVPSELLEWPVAAATLVLEVGNLLEIPEAVPRDGVTATRVQASPAQGDARRDSDDEIVRLQASVRELTEQLETARARHGQALNEVNNLREAVQNERFRSRFRYDGLLESARHDNRVLKSEREELLEQLVALVRSNEAFAAESRDLRAQVTDLDSRLASALADVSSLRPELAVLRGDRDAIEAKLRMAQATAEATAVAGRTELERLTGAVTSLRGELDAARARLSTSRRRHAALIDFARAMADENTALQRNVHDLSSDLASMRAREVALIAEHEDIITAITTSRSWRWTRPLRSGMWRLRGGRARRQRP